MSSGNEPLDIKAELTQAGAILEGHMVLTTGLHSPGYICFDSVYPEVDLMMRIARALVEPFRDEHFDVVAAPGVGGIALAIYAGVAANSLVPYPVKPVWADKHGREFSLGRMGFQGYVSGSRVLVVEDVITSGDSVKRVLNKVEEAGGTVVGVSAVCDRNDGRPGSNVPRASQLAVPRFEAMAKFDIPAVPAWDCELCILEQAIATDLGHGAQFEEDNPNYKGGYISLLS